MADNYTEDEAFLAPYMKLRTILDGLEASVMWHVLEDKNSGERIRRAKAMEELILPVIDKIPMDVIGKRCPDGYYNCDGVCVPYVCPNWS